MPGIRRNIWSVRRVHPPRVVFIENLSLHVSACVPLYLHMYELTIMFISITPLGTEKRRVPLKLCECVIKSDTIGILGHQQASQPASHYSTTQPLNRSKQS